MSKEPKPAGMAEFSFLPDLVPQPMEPSTPVGAEGHRLRMRQRLLKAGPDALADYEMLEMILFIALPRRDTKPLARALLARFRTFGGVLGAPPTELMGVDGIGEAGAAALKLVQAAALRMMRQDIAAQPVLSTWERLTDYLMAAMGHERVEQFRVLFLDGKNKLIADEVQGTGTINHAPAYPREVVRRCLELHASAVILAHNHPSGEPAPSREDVVLTTDIVRAAATMGIAVHDHIIIGRGKWLSFRAEKLF
ncbi:DNA repair protein RadC [Acidisphaera sp. S103]|uniref:RadC family protein n=1 Tax=Acidisphaera sp. S103 TaxID=1747223 RepID=UPI00131E3014